ncbi:lytic transglycosylase [Bacteroidia bacterium]|nr:lytic transglycosylase [Bacteroidia bacterium]
MKRIFLVLFLLSGTINLFSQSVDSSRDIADTSVLQSDGDDMLFVPESWDISLDSLQNSWYIQHCTRKSNHPGYEDCVPVSDAVYVERLSKLDNLIELPYNEVVRRCIELYVVRKRYMVEYMLGLENLYFPMIEEALDANGLPLELKYLAIVESALNPTALSRAGASGLWQFMLATGKQYGLEINTLVDERRDPLKATYAACAYFKDMYKLYGDWHLVIASYNCGAGNVNKAIRRAGGKTDYWAIYPYLPRETRLYVPLFIAATYAMNYYANHQLYPVATTLPVATDTVMINQAIHFDQIAEMLNIDKDLLRSLNPQYKRDIIPGNSKPRAMRLPTLQTYAFVEKEDSIAKYRRDELFTNRTYVGENQSSSSSSERITHKVRKGESLSKIGSRYGVTVAELRRWNKLKSNKVAAGRRLIIYQDNGRI